MVRKFCIFVVSHFAHLANFDLSFNWLAVSASLDHLTFFYAAFIACSDLISTLAVHLSISRAHVDIFMFGVVTVPQATDKSRHLTVFVLLLWFGSCTQQKKSTAISSGKKNIICRRILTCENKRTLRQDGTRFLTFWSWVCKNWTDQTGEALACSRKYLTLTYGVRVW